MFILGRATSYILPAAVGLSAVLRAAAIPHATDDYCSILFHTLNIHQPETKATISAIKVCMIIP